MKKYTLVQKLFLLSLLFISALSATAQHKYTDWYTVFDVTANGEGSNFNNIVSDGESIIANGVYTLNGIFQGVDLPMAPSKNAIVTKLDYEGDHQWISTLTGNNIDAFFDMAVDGNGDILLCGYSSSDDSIRFNGAGIAKNPQSFSTTSLIMKLSGDDGTLQWVTYFHSGAYLSANTTRMAIGPDNNVFVGGYYSGDFTVGGISIDYNKNYGNDLFFLKLDPDGTPLWAETVECVQDGGYASPQALAANDEALYIAMQYSKAYVAGDTTLPYAGAYYWNGILKMDKETGVISSVQAYGMSNDQGYQVLNRMDQDSEGNMVAVGYFNGDYTLDIGDFSLSGLGFDESYIAKFDADLDVLWAKSAGCVNADRIFNIHISADDRIFANGGFASSTPLIFDGAEVLESITPGNMSKFELVLDPEGELLDAYGLYGSNWNTVITSTDAVHVTAGDQEFLFCAGNVVYEIEFMEDEFLNPDHELGYIFLWDVTPDGPGNVNCQDFDELTAGGYVAEQLGGLWTTWSGTPGGSDDAVVSDAVAFSGSNSMLVDGTADLVHLFDDENITSGVYQYTFMIYIPTGTTGYFNLQKDVVPGTEWGFQVMFEDDGMQYIDGNGAAAVVIPFEYDTWISCEMIVNLDLDWMQYYVDGELIHEYQWTLGTFGDPGANTLGGANFYANAGASGTPPGAHFDDICLEEITPDPCEDFDELVAGGFVAEQLGGLWTTWSGTPGGADDAPVTDDLASSNPNSFTVNDGSVDLVRQLGYNPIASGQWLYSHSMYVPSGYSGYFNVQSEPTPGVDWVVELFFDDGGSGSLVEDGTTTNFYYPQDTWFTVELNFDLDTDQAELIFNGYTVHQWFCDFTIGGIDYWGSDSGGLPGAYYDDVCFEEGWPVTPPDLDPPANLEGSIEEEDIYLTWDAPGGGAGIEELIYDNNTYTDGYSYNGFTMSTHMSPSGPCQLLTLRFHTAGSGVFNATVFGWEGSQPGTDKLYEEMVPVVEDDWLDVDVSGQNIMFDSDFTVGFGSVNATAFLHYDADLNNGRSWDYDNAGNWYSWFEAYLIRAVVEYPDGSKETIGGAIGGVKPVLAPPTAGLNVHPIDYPASSYVTPIDKVVPGSKGLTGYNVYYQLNNGGFELLGNTTETAYVHEGMALNPGLHEYYVTAVYDEGESGPSNTVAVLIDALGENHADKLRVYPNPAADWVTVETDEQIVSVRVYDFTGRLIHQQTVQSRICRLDIRALNSGQYILQAETANDRTAIRIVKK